MDNKEKVNAIINLKNGIYSATIGTDTIIKSISDYNYDEKSMDTRRKEIESELLGLREAPSQLKKQIDVVLYDLLKEVDNIRGTDYARAYFNMTTKHRSTTVSEKDSDFKKRVIAEKRDELENAGISIEYDLSLGSNLNFAKRIQAFKLALAQRNNGIGINFNKKREGLDPIYTGSSKPVKVEKTRKLPKMEDVKAFATEKLGDVRGIMQVQLAKLKSVDLGSMLKLGKKKEAEKQPIIKVVPPSQPQPQPAQQPKVQPQPQPQPVQQPKVQPQPQPQPAQQPKVQPKTQPKTQPKSQPKQQSKSKKQQASTPKKETKKEKTIRLRKEAASQKKAKLKGKKEAQRNAKEISKQKRIERQAREAEEQARKDAKLSSRIKKLILGKKESGNQEEHLVKRFTRKLKDKKDSIRNKVHIPQMSNKQKKIAGAVGAVLLVGAIGIAAFTMNSNKSTNDFQEPSVGITQTTETPAPTSTPEIVTGETGSGTTGSGTNHNLGTTITRPSAPIIENNIPGKVDGSNVNPGGQEAETPAGSETSARDEYLSSVRVGSTMNIQEGKYFECPDGTGNYGYFENYQDGAKEITIIGISTYEGYIVIKDSNVSLKELKEKYPDAKFSYHFVCRHPDGRTTTLGWLTESSMEQTKDGQNLQLGEER